MTRAAVYVRISDDREGLERGVERQEADCRKLAKKIGWEVAEVYSDNDISATSGRPRPAWSRLLKDLGAGTVEAVLAYSSSRMYRRLANLAELLTLAKDRGVQIETVASGKIDLTTADGRMLAGILASIDQGEAERTGERVRRTKAQRRDAGTHNGGGRRAFGYEFVKGTGIVVRPDEAALIREAANRVLAGETLYRIATDWNDRGVRTAGGERWRQRTLKRILVGMSEKRGTARVAGGANWDAILTADELELVRARLTAPSKYAPKTPGTFRRYPLTGLLVCTCGGKLRGAGGFYKCEGCGAGITALPVERLLDQEVARRRDRGQLREAPVDPVPPADQDSLVAELRAVELQIETLADQATTATSGTARRVLERAIEKLAVREEAARAALAASVPEAAQTPDTWDELYADAIALYERWDAGELTDTEVVDLHAMFAAYLESATIAPRGRAPRGRGATFDAGRVRPTWRAA